MIASTEWDLLSSSKNDILENIIYSLADVVLF